MPTRKIPAAPVGQNLKRALAETGMTQEALAREIDIGLRSVQGWCTGETLPRWGQLVALARALNREPGWFYAEHDDDGEAAA